MMSDNSKNGHIKLRDLQLSVHSAQALKQILMSPKSFIHLDLSKNSLGDEGISILASVIAKSKSITVL